MGVEQMNIEQILSHGECEYIEYKQRWYWDLPKKQEENTQKCIGEFIKDFLALVNANESAFFSKIRYLIIGYDECSQDVHDFGLNETNFKDIQEIMRRNIKKFISNSSQLKYNIEREKYNGTNIIVVSIFAPSQVHSLSKSIDTKTISYQSGTSLYRSDHGNSHNKSDNVGVMPPEIIHRLSEKNQKKW